MTEYSIVSAKGTLPLGTLDGESPVTLEYGTTGLGLPPEVLSILPSPAGGGRFKGSHVGIRESVLVLGIRGGSPQETESIANLVAKHVDAANSPALVASREDGQVFRLGFYRDGGGEEARQQVDTYLRWSIGVRSPKPYWIAQEPETIGPIGLTGEVIGLLPDLAELTVGSSSAFGDVTVENTGDAPSPINWVITGPGGPVTVVVGGRGFVFDAELEAGEIVSITRGDTGWTVTDQTDANRYSDMGPAPKFPSAPPGTSKGSILMDGASAGASVTGYFQPRRKMVI